MHAPSSPPPATSRIEEEDGDPGGITRAEIQRRRRPPRGVPGRRRRLRGRGSRRRPRRHHRRESRGDPHVGPGEGDRKVVHGRCWVTRELGAIGAFARSSGHAGRSLHDINSSHPPKTAVENGVSAVVVAPCALSSRRAPTLRTAGPQCEPGKPADPNRVTASTCKIATRLPTDIVSTTKKFKDARGGAPTRGRWRQFPQPRTKGGGGAQDGSLRVPLVRGRRRTRPESNHQVAGCVLRSGPGRYQEESDVLDDGDVASDRPGFGGACSGRAVGAGRGTPPAATWRTDQHD